MSKYALAAVAFIAGYLYAVYKLLRMPIERYHLIRMAVEDNDPNSWLPPRGER